MPRQFSTAPAFSLIELLVSMAIIGIGLLGISSLAAQNIRVQYFNRNSLISAQLAQEGLELARNLRDNDWKSSSPITSSSSLEGLYNDLFTIDYLGHINTYSVPQSVPLLNIDSDGFYSYNPGTPTPFKRYITSQCQDNYCLLSCVVTWQAEGQSGSYEVNSYLYAWH
ncbi:MAG TPA: prepilin-type N-terminal cleavage/methylation domain-containing protein [bacterium]|jgi:prepilin-type N-terminal cleavage/methylation domain-containing protein|nr:prepilin-type N-terminal cleavage/methylation domain-containing protein [bacterium]HPX64807.1 prepilin-type N-terminal cleavage/methylation domain-containing protein [bacterium]HQB26503.1 prepilin-type N-terminal cleavage/methylation domain-containing protein [bacterium]